MRYGVMRNGAAFDWDPKRRADLVRRLRAEGLTLQQIGDRLGGIRRQRVYQICKREGIVASCELRGGNQRASVRSA